MEFLTIRQEAEKYKLMSETRLRQLQKENKVPGYYSGTRFYVEHESFVQQLQELVNQSVNA
ncbi:MAG: hypothetical protein IJG40_16050 [Oscillospiraceae bacterium]|nr:hypothetical protein [Oscillospiraceae bacterium]